MEGKQVEGYTEGVRRPRERKKEEPMVRVTVGIALTS
jgi:hypothetical protein